MRYNVLSIVNTIGIGFMSIFCYFFLRYIQVGNAVAVPVARALGYALGLAFHASSSLQEPLFRLPQKFPNILERYSSAASEDDA
jgi:hypothetical protein